MKKKERGLKQIANFVFSVKKRKGFQVEEILTYTNKRKSVFHIKQLRYNTNYVACGLILSFLVSKFPLKDLAKC